MPTRIPFIAFCRQVFTLSHYARLMEVRSGLWQCSASPGSKKGPCLVTALHVLSDAQGVYLEKLRVAGLMVLTMAGKRLVLGTRTWALYEHVDVALLELTEDETQLLGGALDLVGAPGTQMLWVGYGFPASQNRQKHRTHPFALHGNRIVLYDRTEPPKRFGGDPGHHMFFKYDLKPAYVPSGKRQQPAPDLDGCSGGLVAAYIHGLARWMPLGESPLKQRAPSFYLSKKSGCVV